MDPKNKQVRSKELKSEILKKENVDGDEKHLKESKHEILKKILLSGHIQIRPEYISAFIVFLPKHPATIGLIPWSFLNEEKWRLCTYVNYPCHAVKSAILLAADGFVYLGHDSGISDTVVCYFCECQKTGWLAKDDISKIHQQLSPSCPMVTKAPCLNIPLFKHLTLERQSLDHTWTTQGAVASARNQLYDNNLSDIAAAPIHSSREEIRRRRVENIVQKDTAASNTQMTAENAGEMDIIPWRLVAEPTYSNNSVRCGSFRGTLLAQLAADLARSGFYYLGIDQFVGCFYCGIHLRILQLDIDVYLVHSQHSPDCNYLRFLLGSGFMDSLQNAFRIVRYTLPAEDNIVMCRNCQVNPCVVLFLPCRHCSLCVDCGISAAVCHICSSRVLYLKRVCFASLIS